MLFSEKASTCDAAFRGATSRGCLNLLLSHLFFDDENKGMGTHRFAAIFSYCFLNVSVTGVALNSLCQVKIFSLMV